MGDKEQGIKVVPEGIYRKVLIDPRHKNWLLALRMMVRELWDLSDGRVNGILERYGVKEIGGDTDNFPLTNIEFPSDVSRIQFFVNEKGEEYVKYIEGVRTKQI